ncbi:hypothetical protein ACFL2V_22225 [Pseudomonadota bacterium]
MATRRMILKSDVEGPKWRHISIRQRYIYWGLSLFADDDGIIPLYWVHNRIIFDIDGVTDADIRQDLSDLEVNDFIKTYTDKDGDKYIQISYWWDKQFIDKKLYKPTSFEKPSTYIPRPEDLTKKRNHSFYDDSSKVLGQNRKDKTNKEKCSSDQTISDKPRREEEVDLPF